MKIINYFSHAAEKELAKSLSLQLIKEIPPNLIEKRLKLLSVNKVTKLLERVYKVAYEYQTTHRTGFIKRAVLANSFKWELKTHGYTDEFVEMATEGLIVSLTKKGKTPSTPA